LQIFLAALFSPMDAEGGFMQRLRNMLLSLGWTLFFASFACGAGITGTVRSPQGTPVRAAYVHARNSKTRASVIVFSDSSGHYKIENLPAGDYLLQARATGFRSDPVTGIVLGASDNPSFDLTLQKQTVHWNEIPIWQGDQLFPAGPGKDKFVRCGSSCHGFQQFISIRRDENGWRESLYKMTTRIGGGVILGILKNQQDVDELAAYAGKNFGPGPGAMPASPADLPGYEDWMKRFSDEALKIVYVTYEMPPGRMTWDANPDKDGNVWCPYFGTVNGVGRLNPATGELREYLWESQLPRVGTRSAQMTRDGTTTWVVEEGGTLVKVNVKTGRQTKYKGPGQSMNTVREDPSGILWISGGPFSYRFDPKTGSYKELRDVPNTYGVNLDMAGNPWFDEVRGQGRIFKVDYKTGKVTTWTPPPQPGTRRRLQVDSNGNAYLAQFDRGQIVRLDSETGAFREYALPGIDPTPYPIGIDQNDQVWYASGTMDIVGRLDPKTGKVIEYPPPAVGNGMRELNNDSKGRMWFASPGNNTVGYMYLAK
jgi:virginiamycin B lyase